MIVIVFYFHCLSIDVALFLLKLVSHVFACVVHYSFVFSSVVRRARRSLCRSLSFCLYCSVVRLARLSLCHIYYVCADWYITICSAGFNHLVAVVKMENWLISFNVYI